MRRLVTTEIIAVHPNELFERAGSSCPLAEVVGFGVVRLLGSLKGECRQRVAPIQAAAGEIIAQRD
jgi:hypothetical protein